MLNSNNIAADKDFTWALQYLDILQQKQTINHHFNVIDIQIT